MQTSLAYMPINNKQKGLKVNTIPKNVISDICWATLREEVIKATNKKLKTNYKNFENTKLQ